MRARIPIVLLGLLGTVALPGLGAPPTAVAASGASAPPTARVVVAPVDSTGHAVAGYSVHAAKHRWERVDCRYPDPSPGAVSPNIEFCSPSAAYAIACWKSAAAGKVLCMRDPTGHKLYEMRHDGKFAKTNVAKPRDRAPLLIVLTDGSRCQIRDGGAWGQLKGHPNLYGAYSCDRWGAAWLRSTDRHTDAHNGIDESEPSWTIRTGGKHIVRRHIAKAYFVATAA